MPEGLTGAQLINAARRAGYKISEHTLKRLRHGGLIRPPEPRPTRGVAGVAQVYPDGTLEQLLAVCELRNGAWRFDELRIMVWWNRRWIDRDQLRISLKTVLNEDPETKRLRTAYENANRDPLEAAHLVLEQDSSDDIRHPGMRLLLRRLNGDRDDLYTVAYTLLVLALGGEPEWDSTDVGLDSEASGEHIVEASPRELLERAMGIDRLLSDDLPNGPLLKGRPDIAKDMVRLRDIGALDFLSPATIIGNATDIELDTAREKAAVLFDMLPVAAKAIEAMYGRDFAAMGLFRATSQRASAFQRASLVRYAVLLPSLVDDQAFQDVSAALVANNPLFHVVLQVTQAFPGYRKFFTPAGVEQLDALAVEELTHFRSGLAEFMAGNPEVAKAVTKTAESAPDK